MHKIAVFVQETSSECPIVRKKPLFVQETDLRQQSLHIFVFFVQEHACKSRYCRCFRLAVLQPAALGAADRQDRQCRQNSRDVSLRPIRRHQG